MAPFIIFIVSFALHVFAKLPEEDIPVPDIIKYWGYPVEVHELETDDGYYLTLHRIPRGKNKNITNRIKRPVLLQHGLLGSSSNWVANPPDESLGFMLADVGHDVWLGNARGNTYSKKHQTLDVSSRAFWQFTLDDLALYDFPAMIKYILRVTSHDQLYHIGHSQGNQMAFAGLSDNEYLQDKIKCLFALAPITRMKKVHSKLKYFSRFQTEFSAILRILGINECLPSNRAIKFFADKLCPIDKNICRNIGSFIAGYDKKDINMTRLPVYYSHTPAGTSIKNAFHFAQLLGSEKFQKYDYGYIENLVRYHSFHPPRYQMQKITIPVVLLSGSDDWISTPDDVVWAAQQLKGLFQFHEVQGYNHLDFIWGMTANEKVYRRVMKALNIFEK